MRHLQKLLWGRHSAGPRLAFYRCPLISLKAAGEVSVQYFNLWPSADQKNGYKPRTFAVMSDGERAESPKYKALDRKIRKLQKKLARQPKDSKRRYKTRIQIAKLHNQIADTRKDFLHKLSTKVVSENQTIVLEDLNVSGMVKRRERSQEYTESRDWA